MSVGLMIAINSVETHESTFFTPAQFAIILFAPPIATYFFHFNKNFHINKLAKNYWILLNILEINGLHC